MLARLMIGADMVETKMGWSERCEMETRKEEEKEGEGGESLGK